MKLLATGVCVTLIGCASIDAYTTEQVLDWPVLTIREHPDQVSWCWNKMSPLRKAFHVAMLAPPVGCSWVNLCEKTCDIYYPSYKDPCPDNDFGCIGAQGVREHELAHCYGKQHPADILSSEHYQYWKAGKCGHDPI